MQRLTSHTLRQLTVHIPKDLHALKGGSNSPILTMLSIMPSQKNLCTGTLHTAITNCLIGKEGPASRLNVGEQLRYLDISQGLRVQLLGEVDCCQADPLPCIPYQLAPHLQHARSQTLVRTAVPHAA